MPAENGAASMAEAVAPTSDGDPHKDRPVDFRSMIALLFLIAAGPTISVSTDLLSPGADAARSCMDANLAPWWELALLPEIGVSTARNVTAYRSEMRALVARGDPAANGAAPGATSGRSQRHAPVFRSATDLAKVRGIGPATVARIRTHLCPAPG